PALYTLSLHDALPISPDLNGRAQAQKALDAIHGVDLNPYAVAITRFRLTIAALQASGDRSLEDAPDFAYHLAVGDSLLHGLDQGDRKSTRLNSSHVKI